MEKRKPMLLPAPQEGAHASGSRRVKSALGVASEISGSLRAMRNVVPSAEVVVRSFDADRERGTVVSGALAAMGLPVDNAISNPDDDADVYNASDSTPVKSDRYSMLLFHLLIGEAEPDVIRSVKTALKAKDAQGLEFAPLSGRRFRFLSEQNINQARGYYEDLRNEYPHLPSQSPYAPDPAERSLPKRDGVALLDWLRPEISDAIFEKACAAYTLI